MRLIDADALMEKYHKTSVWDSWVEINSAPTVDAVPVVRCKDCIWYAEKETGEGWCSEVMARPMPHNGFCSYGERKEEAQG